MSTRVLKKLSFSAVPSFFKLLFVVPLSLLFFTNNCCSAGATERDPLIVNEHRIDVEAAPQLTASVRTSYPPLADIVVDRTALTPPNPVPAEQAMTKIANYIMYASGEEDLMKAAAGDKWTGAANEALMTEFFEAAFAELDQTAPLGVYLQGVLVQITHLQTVVPQLHERNRILATRVSELFDQIGRWEREQQQLLPRASKTGTKVSTTPCWKSPVIFFIGGFVGAVITFGITYGIMRH